MPSPDGVRSVSTSVRFGALLPASVVAFETRHIDGRHAMLRAEAAHVRGCAEIRRHEFASGRACARAALHGLGIDGFELLPGSHRQPLWPANVVGSITHTRDFAAAAAVSSCNVASIGIDAERTGAVQSDLWSTVCTDSELTWLGSLPASTMPTAATIIFSAKEAFFKCQYPLTGAWLDFRDVSVSMTGQVFTVQTHKHLAVSAPGVAAWRGRFAFDSELVVTAICIERD